MAKKCSHLDSVKAVTPIISSFEPGEDWSWCFLDDLQVFLP
jgi:hypothetical protein